jgi:hypothetical protein
MVDHFLESAKDVLRAKSYDDKMQFMGVAVEDFEKEDLIRILHWAMDEKRRILKSNEQEREMRRFFAEARSAEARR